MYVLYIRIFVKTSCVRRALLLVTIFRDKFKRIESTLNFNIILTRIYEVRIFIISVCPL